MARESTAMASARGARGTDGYSNATSPTSFPAIGGYWTAGIVAQIPLSSTWRSRDQAGKAERVDRSGEIPDVRAAVGNGNTAVSETRHLEGPEDLGGGRSKRHDR